MNELWNEPIYIVAWALFVVLLLLIFLYGLLRLVKSKRTGLPDFKFTPPTPNNEEELVKQRLREAQSNAEVLLSVYVKRLRQRGYPERRIRRMVKSKFNITIKSE